MLPAHQLAMTKLLVLKLKVSNSKFPLTIFRLEADLLRKKVKAMSRMMKMFKTLREENESVVQLKGICPDGKVPKGLLLEGKRAIESELVDR